MTESELRAFWSERAVAQSVAGMRLEGMVLLDAEIQDLKLVVDGSLSIEDYVRQGFDRANAG